MVSLDPAPTHLWDRPIGLLPLVHPLITDCQDPAPALLKEPETAQVLTVSMVNDGPAAVQEGLGPRYGVKWMSDTCEVAIKCHWPSLSDRPWVTAPGRLPADHLHNTHSFWLIMRLKIMFESPSWNVW